MQDLKTYKNLYRATASDRPSTRGPLGGQSFDRSTFRTAPFRASLGAAHCGGGGGGALALASGFWSEGFSGFRERGFRHFINYGLSKGDVGLRTFVEGSWFHGPEIWVQCFACQRSYPATLKEHTIPHLLPNLQPGARKRQTSPQNPNPSFNPKP